MQHDRGEERSLRLLPAGVRLAALAKRNQQGYRINGEVVGVEVMPNSLAFLALWEPLIRDCYGAEALLHASNAPVAVPVIIDDVESLDDLVTAVNDLARREKAWAESLAEVSLTQKERLRFLSSVRASFGSTPLRQPNLRGSSCSEMGILSTCRSCDRRHDVTHDR